MDKDRLKGKAKDVGGRIERQMGEWTGDKEAQAAGAGKQVEGKVQNAFGKLKDKTREMSDDIRRKAEDRDRETIVEKKEVKIKGPRKAA